MNTLSTSVGGSAADLSGIWDFTFLKTPLDALKVSKLRFDSCAAVPGCFDFLPQCRMMRGTGVYRRQVTCGGEMILTSEGLGLRGAFFWDGKKIGSTEFPFTLEKFRFDAGAPGPHELIIAVNNEFDDSPGSLFRRNYDFYAHGGIYRPVSIAPVQPIELETLQVIPLDAKKGEVEVTIVLTGKTAKLGSAALRWDDGVFTDTLKLKNGRGKGVFRVPDPKVWSPETPDLHTVTVKVKEQEFSATFGIRVITISKGKLLLNGKALKIAGTNRHDAHPDFGYAVPDEIRLRDLLMLKHQGFNCIRGCHYPQSGAFLDMCDRLGMMVWEESLGWGNRAEVGDPLFRERQIRQTAMMARKSINHPCVIMWGCLNECASETPEGRELVKMLIETLHKADPSRPVTFGSNRSTRDICMDLVDIISFNTYPCWYGGSEDQYFDKEGLYKSLQVLVDFASTPEYKNKPLFISEIGAEAIPGNHSGMRWSEEYQASLLSEAMRYVLESKRCTGIFLWQFCDIRTYISCNCQSRPGGFNRKGMVEGNRNPKPSFREVGKVIAEFFAKKAAK